MKLHLLHIYTYIHIFIFKITYEVSYLSTKHYFFNLYHFVLNCQPLV